jgi:hypothetical protein
MKHIYGDAHQAILTIEMVSTALVKELQRMDRIISGPPSREIGLVFFMPCSVLEALKALDQRFGKMPVEKYTTGLAFQTWRNLKANGMELRIRFFTSSYDSDQNLVEVSGFKTNDSVPVYWFSRPVAYDCYVRFLDGLTLSRSHASAVAMGQHARLGSQSLLGMLPEALFRSLLQPHISTLEHWDCEKEDRAKAVIKQQKFEVTKGLLDEVLKTRSSEMTGKLSFHGIRGVYKALVALDQRFGERTLLEDEHSFFLRRMLTINDRTLQFTFAHDKYTGPSYIGVRGLEHVKGLSCWDLDDEAFVYLMDTLLSHAPTRCYEVIDE